jgi:DNA repair exonuclease SbcCD nuclease subunit
MTIKFAHMADIHLGAFRDDRLRQLNLEAFGRALDSAVEEDVQFIIISGDLFNTPIPEISVVNSAIRKMKEIRDRGIRIYITYGSHDYSATTSSMVDLVESAGLFTKISVTESSDEDRGEQRLKLGFVKDDTGARITGLPGRKGSLEKSYYEILDLEPLEKATGVKIFAFHSALTELRPDYIPEAGSIPLSYLPKGFTYYAGGHVHEHIKKNEKGYGLIVYPGPTFGSDYRDLEVSSRTPRGFYIVEIDEETGKVNATFRGVKVAEIKSIRVDVENLEPAVAGEKLREEALKIKAEGAVILLKIEGKLCAGRASEIDVRSVEKELFEAGARVVFVNKHQLRGAELEKIKVGSGTRGEIQEKLFKEYIQNFDSKEEYLRGDGGLETARALFKVLSCEKPPEGMSVADYEEGIVKEAMPVIDPEEAGKGGGEE